jgi:hypothetical protein
MPFLPTMSNSPHQASLLSSSLIMILADIQLIETTMDEIKEKKTTSCSLAKKPQLDGLETRVISQKPHTERNATLIYLNRIINLTLVTLARTKFTVMTSEAKQAHLLGIPTNLYQ